MKRIILTALLLTALLIGSASAERLDVEVDLPYDDPYTYMLRSGDTLHCLTIGWEGLRLPAGFVEIPVNGAAQCSALENGALVPCQDHCADRFHQRVIPYNGNKVIPSSGFFGIVISPQNQTYLIDGDWAVYQWTPGEEDPWRYLCSLDTSLFEFDDYVGLYTFTADGDTLYGAFNDRVSETSVVFTFSLTSGACQKLFTTNAVGTVYPVDENRVVFKGATEDSYGFALMNQYDLVSGKKTELIKRDVPYEFIPDGQGGWYGIILGEEGGLFHYGKDGSGEMIAPVLQGVYSFISLSLSEDRTTAYLCGSQGFLVICPLSDGGSEPTPELVLAGALNEIGSTNAMPDVTEFLMANSGLRIRGADYPATFDDLALELVSGSDQFDIMVLELSMGNVDSLLDKGYYVNLSGEDSIAAYVQSLYPTWREECLRGDQVVGIPVNARNLYMFMANLAVWEKEGLGDCPKTYDELFDRIEEWDSMGVLDEVPLFDNGFSSFSWLLDRIMYDYMGKCKREGKPIVFADETLLRLLSRLEELRPILDAHDARNITGDGLIFEGFLGDIVYLRGVNRFEVTAESTFVPLPLGISGEGDCVESVYFTMLVINPNSKRQELAKAYLAYLAEHPTTWARCHLLQDGPVGVREKGYEHLDEQYEALLAELDEKIAAAMKEGDDAVVSRWEGEKRDLTDKYLNMWEVRPNMAEMLYQMMPYFTPLTSDGFRFLNNSCDDLTAMFLEGRMDSRTYAMRLDERMRMAEMEGNR